jgi:glyoxylase-like metal-dependent hydrolase (beta-lactamase superfamily II)
MQSVTPYLYSLHLGIANVFVLRGPSGLVLIDAAVQGSVAKLEAALKQHRWSLTDIRHILITHSHYDHVGGLKEVQTATGAQVWAQRLEAPGIQGEQPVSRPDPAALRPFDRLMTKVFGGNQTPSPVHKTLEGNEDLSPLFPGLRVVALPGHTPGQIGLWLEAERVLIGGDVVMNVLPWPRPTLPLPAYTVDMVEAKRSVAKAAALKPQTLCVGHGPPLRNAVVGLEGLLQRIKKHHG